MHMQGGIVAQVLEQEKGISWGKKKTQKTQNFEISIKSVV